MIFFPFVFKEPTLNFDNYLLPPFNNKRHFKIFFLLFEVLVILFFSKHIFCTNDNFFFNQPNLMVGVIWVEIRSKNDVYCWTENAKTTFIVGRRYSFFHQITQNSQKYSPNTTKLEFFHQIFTLTKPFTQIRSKNMKFTPIFQIGRQR